jgi:hypothetical protein
MKGMKMESIVALAVGFWVLAAVTALGFWGWMFVDVVFRQREDKIVWAFVVVFFNVLGSLAYYFFARKRRIASTITSGCA